MDPSHPFTLCQALSHPSVQELLHRLHDDDATPFLVAPTTTALPISATTILVVWWYFLAVIFLVSHTSTRIQCRGSK